MAKKSKQVFGGASGIRGVDLAEVERLLEFMQKHGLEEFEYETSSVHIRLKKASNQSSAPVQLISSSEVSGPAPTSSAESAARSSAAGTTSDLHLIKSPIVGTFYAAPSPGADPFVARGGRVDIGQVLCIIEAMKLMNEIESDVAGEIVEIYPENGSPVEYGQPLFGIRPQGKK